MRDFTEDSKEEIFVEIKVFGLGDVLKLPNSVSYVLRGRDSSYFDFIHTFGLN